MSATWTPNNYLMHHSTPQPRNFDLAKMENVGQYQALFKKLTSARRAAGLVQEGEMGKMQCCRRNLRFYEVSEIVSDAL